MRSLAERKEHIKLMALRLRAIRLANGYENISTFTAAFNLTRSNYRLHELGEREMKSTDLLYYAKKFNIACEWLLAGDGAPYRSKNKSLALTQQEAKIFYYLEIETMKLRFYEKTDKVLEEKLQIKQQELQKKLNLKK